MNEWPVTTGLDLRLAETRRAPAELLLQSAQDLVRPTRIRFSSYILSLSLTPKELPENGRQWSVPAHPVTVRHTLPAAPESAFLADKKKEKKGEAKEEP